MMKHGMVGALVALFRGALIGGALLGGALLGGAAGATVVEPLTVAERVARSDAVVHGRVVAVESGWHEDRAMIYTVATVEVVAVLAGAARAGERLAVRRLGGRVGAVEQVVAGNAVLRAGDEAVLFLKRHGDFHAVVGMAEGVVPVGEGTVARLRPVVEEALSRPSP